MKMRNHSEHVLKLALIDRLQSDIESNIVEKGSVILSALGRAALTCVRERFRVRWRFFPSLSVSLPSLFVRPLLGLFLSDVVAGIVHAPPTPPRVRKEEAIPIPGVVTSLVWKCKWQIHERGRGGGNKWA